MAKDNLKHNCSVVNKMISEGLLFTYGIEFILPICAAIC